MQPQGGLLIAAILVLAIATGCRRDDKPGAARTKEADYGAAPGSAAGFSPVIERHEDRPPVSPVSGARRPRQATTQPAPASGPGLGRATDELDEIGREAVQLRSALLHADFRSFGRSDGQAEADERANREVETDKEAHDDSR